MAGNNLVQLNNENEHDILDVINVLSTKYYCIVRINLDSGEVIPMHFNTSISVESEIYVAEQIDSMESLLTFLGFGMAEEEYNRLEETLDLDNIRIDLWDEGVYERTFKWSGMNGDYYYRLNFIGVGEAPYNNVVLTVLDVTERRLAEIENRKNSRIVEALSDDFLAIMFVEAETQNIRVYRAAKEVLDRYGSALTTQKRYGDIIDVYVERCVKVSKEDAIYKYRDFNTLMEEVKEKGIVSFVYNRVLGEESRQYRVKVVKIEENGEFLGVVIGIKDVEDEFRKDKETQELLQNALDEAKHASESKSNFLFNMSHDIRTPMNAILGFASLAGKEVDDREKLLDYLSKIESSGQHLLGLINDVLDMARIESGKIDIRKEVVNLEQLFNEIVDMFRLDMEAKNITFESTLNINNKIVETDGLRLKQIVFNLLGNALKYTPEGGKVWFEVNEHPSDKPGIASYETVVRDNGIGMSEEFQKHLFELFEREDRASVTGAQGTGLGLAITKRLLDLMNGTIQCKSTVGEGTEFTYFVRLSICDADIADEEEEEIDMSLLKGKRVLLVEDNDLNREIAKTLLEDVGMIVTEATDGTVAVDMIGEDSSSIDVVLMDIQMPYMDGYQATRIIRNTELRTMEHIPIIAMTANAFAEDKKKALDAGMDAHIAKPVDITELYKELIRLS